MPNKVIGTIDDSDIFYALLPDGYIGCSVTIELAYAYARGKEIVVSEAPAEFAVRALVTKINSPDQFIARFALNEGDPNIDLK